MYFSIIVPVYNVEKYLNRCIDSILSQGFKSYEIILVDDGATDSCPAICDKYGLLSNKIKVVHQKNGGLSKARNVGMEKAIGQYIMFLDSDDWIAEYSLSTFAKIIDKDQCDLIVGRARTISDEGKSRDKVPYKIAEGLYKVQDYLKMLFVNDSYCACAPFTLCKREFLLNNKLMFKEGIIHEDEIWTPSILLKADNVYVSSFYFYYHYFRECSINNSKNYDESGQNILKVVDEIKKMLDCQLVEPAKVIREQVVILFLQAICLVDDYRKYKLLGRRYIIKNSFHERTKMKAFLYAVSPRLYVVLHKLYSGIIMKSQA